MLSPVTHIVPPATSLLALPLSSGYTYLIKPWVGGTQGQHPEPRAEGVPCMPMCAWGLKQGRQVKDSLLSALLPDWPQMVHNCFCALVSSYINTMSLSVTTAFNFLPFSLCSSPILTDSAQCPRASAFANVLRWNYLKRLLKSFCFSVHRIP